MTKLTGRCLDFYEDSLEGAKDGDVWLQPKLDAEGRINVMGRHTNGGYSGYIAGYVQAAGGRRRFVGWRDIFANEENRYSQAGKKDYAIERVQKMIEALGGQEIHQVKGGWALVSTECLQAAAAAGASVKSPADRVLERLNAKMGLDPTVPRKPFVDPKTNRRRISNDQGTT